MSKCYRITDPHRHDEVVAYTYDKHEAKSFCLINDMEWEKIREEDAENDPNFNDYLLSDLCGILLPVYLVDKMKNNLCDLIHPLKITEGILIASKENCSFSEKEAINITIDVIKRQEMEVLQEAIKSTSYDSLSYENEEFNIDWLKWL